MKNKTKKVVGIICIVLGFIGLFLPFIQGIALIMVGLGFLGIHLSKKGFSRK